MLAAEEKALGEAEEAAAEAAAIEAEAAAARQAYCDELERQPDLLRNSPDAPTLQEPQLEVAPVVPGPLSSALRATLEDLLELCDFGESVVWPSGFDARTAKLRLAER